MPLFAALALLLLAFIAALVAILEPLTGILMLVIAYLRNLFSGPIRDDIKIGGEKKKVEL